MKKKKLVHKFIPLIVALACAALAFPCFACSLGVDPTVGTPGGGSASETENPSGGDDNKPETPPSGTAEPPSGEYPTGGGPSTEKPPEEDPPEDPPAWASNFTLPDADGAMQKLVEIYGGADKVFLLQNGRIARMPCPQGETVTLNMTYEVGEYAKLVLEDSVAEFNEVFSVINPNYKFAINYAPTESDFAAKYSVRMSASDNLAVTETSRVFGLAHVSYYNGFTELGDFGITMKTEVLDNGSYLMTTFKHELMHLLGAGDAYKNAAATKDTLMQSYTVGGCHCFSESDLMFLDALYRNPELNDKAQEIADYIAAYQQTTAHTKAALTAAVHRRLADDLDAEAVIAQARKIGYKDVDELSQSLAGGIARNVDFGKTPVSFREIEYAKTPTETYFGSIDPSTGTYCHGRQTSLGNSQGTKYTDYGDGVLYAAPNGNLYTVMIQAGGYVFAFKRYGSFTSLSDLSLELWHVSK